MRQGGRQSHVLLTNGKRRLCAFIGRHIGFDHNGSGTVDVLQPLLISTQQRQRPAVLTLYKITCLCNLCITL
jgi:hypothetical protein